MTKADRACQVAFSSPSATSLREELRAFTKAAHGFTIQCFECW